MSSDTLQEGTCRMSSLTFENLLGVVGTRPQPHFSELGAESEEHQLSVKSDTSVGEGGIGLN